MIFFGSCWNWCGALHSLGKEMGDEKQLMDLLPFGAVVAIVDLVDCRPSGSFTLDELNEKRFPNGPRHHDFYAWTEGQMGDFGLGRFGWVLENPRPLTIPVPYVGAQRFFVVPDALLRPHPPIISEPTP